MQTFYKILALGSLDDVKEIANKKRVINAIEKGKKYIMIINQNKNKMGQYTKYKFLNKLTQEESVCLERYSGSWFQYEISKYRGGIVIVGGPNDK